MQEKYLKTSSVEHQKIALCGLDLVFGFHPFEVIIFCDKNLKIDDLEIAFLKTLEDIPVLGGRFVREDNGIFLDTDGPGVLMSLVEANGPTPPFSDGLAADVDRELFNPLPSPNAPLSERPVVSIRVTTFSDGNHAIGMQMNHAFGDGVSYYAVIGAWSAHLAGTKVGPLEFSRSLMRVNGHKHAGEPSSRSGIQYGANRQNVGANFQFYTTEFATVELTKHEYQQLTQQAKATSLNAILPRDLLHAMLFKVYGETSKQAGTEPAIANLSYDIRRIAGAGLPLNYFGNGVLLRTLQLTFAELRQKNLGELAVFFKDYSSTNKDSIAQDIDFYQSQYQAGAYNSNGIYTAFPPILSNGGLYINNIIYRSSAPVNFGNTVLGGGMVLSQPFGVRMAMLMANQHGGISIGLSLEKELIGTFKESWNLLVQKVIHEGVQ